MSKNQYLKYEEYDLEDFLGDEFFIDWVKNPNEDTSHFWDIWIINHPEKRELVSNAAYIIRSINYAHSPVLSDQEYLDIFEKIIRHPNSVQNTTPNSWLTKFFKLVPFTRIAAVFLFCFVAWVGFEVYWKGVPVTELVLEEVEWVERSTPKGLKSTVVLSDGTKITLNSESKVRFPKVFDPTKRQIEIEGEAFLEVRKEIRPFIVKTGAAEIEVLGTSFNVKEGPEGEMSVALVSGKVKVLDEKGNQIYLEPSEMVSFTSSGNFIKEGFDEAYLTAWKDRILVFKNSSPKEVADRISKWYGIPVQLTGKFPSNWKYTGEYKEELLENVLSGIEKTSASQFIIEKSLIKFSYLNPKKP
jgi:ferric-dicitrate binding protein FerR (iron transport regulator)